jgi:hypothetical protein
LLLYAKQLFIGANCPIRGLDMRHRGAVQKFAPSCGDAPERLPRDGARQPIFGAIFVEISLVTLFLLAAAALSLGTFLALLRWPC